MGIARRIAELYEIRLNALLDRVEDPREMLDYSHAQQQELLRTLRQQRADVMAARNLAATRERQLQQSADKLEAEAEQAVAADREDLARQALAWRAAILTHVDDLRAEQVALDGDEAVLAASEQRLRRTIEAFGVHKEIIKAHYTAAKATASVSQVVGGAHEEMGEVALATRRAEETTARLQARAHALDELLSDPGQQAVLPTLSPDQIQEQLDAVTTKAGIDAEIARIKDQLAAGTGSKPGGPAGR